MQATTMTFLSALSAGALHVSAPAADAAPVKGTMLPRFAETLAEAGLSASATIVDTAKAAAMASPAVQLEVTNAKIPEESKAEDAPVNVQMASSSHADVIHPEAGSIMNKPQVRSLRAEPSAAETWEASKPYDAKETVISPQPATFQCEQSVSPAATPPSSVDLPGTEPEVKGSQSGETRVRLPEAGSKLPVLTPVAHGEIISASPSKPAAKTDRGFSPREEAATPAKEHKAEHIAQLAQPDHGVATAAAQGNEFMQALPAIPSLQTQEPVLRGASQSVQERPSVSNEIVLPTKGRIGSAPLHAAGGVHPEPQSLAEGPALKPTDTQDAPSAMAFVGRAQTFEAVAMPSPGSRVTRVVEQARPLETTTPLAKRDASPVVASVEQVQSSFEEVPIPAAKIGVTPVRPVVEQVRSLETMGTPLAKSDAPAALPVVEEARTLEAVPTPGTGKSPRPARKATIDGTIAPEPKTNHVSSSPAPVLAAASNHERVTPGQDVVVSQATANPHASSTDTAMPVAAVSVPATSVPVSTHVNVAPLTQMAEQRAPHEWVPVTDAAMPTLTHTTLNASPTVLEVGVPGGSHGWLKIRAEIGDGGTVQASLVSASHAGHETLHRDLPQMAAFLANEQLPVQLHIAETPRSTATDQNLMQFSTAPGGRDGGHQRESTNQQPPASASSFLDGSETVWSSSDYGPPAPLHGGSWVNVVA